MKSINFELGFFEADGRKFYLTETLTIERFIEYEKLQNSMGFNLTFKQIFDSLNDVYRLINANKILDGGIKLYNLMNGIAERVDGKIHPALEICALFVVEEDEDISKYDGALAKSKIEAWKKEGYAMQDFFTLAVNLVEGFTESYRDFTENISKLAVLTEERITSIGESSK
jgi:hypothetical protein